MVQKIILFAYSDNMMKTLKPKKKGIATIKDVFRCTVIGNYNKHHYIFLYRDIFLIGTSPR